MGFVKGVHLPGTVVGHCRIGAVHTLPVHTPYRQSLPTEHAALIAPRGPAMADALLWHIELESPSMPIVSCCMVVCMEA